MRESDYLTAAHGVLDRLRTVPIFDALDEDSLRSIVTLCKIKQYEPGETVIQQGVLDQWVFILISGVLAVSRDGVEINRLSRAGDVFGEMGVIEAAPRSATVKAVKPSICLALDGSAVDRFEPGPRVFFEAVFYKVASENLSARLRKAGEELAQRSAKAHSLGAELEEVSAVLRAFEEKYGPI